MESTGRGSTPGAEVRAAMDGEAWRGVRAIVAELLQRPESAITPEASLESELGFDSLTTIELSVRLEERFDIAMPAGASPADLSIKTVADVVRFVERLLAEPEGRAAE